MGSKIDDILKTRKEVYTSSRVKEEEEKSEQRRKYFSELVSSFHSNPGYFSKEYINSMLTGRSLVSLRDLYCAEPLKPGQQANYPIADDFSVPVFILPKKKDSND